MQLLNFKQCNCPISSNATAHFLSNLIVHPSALIMLIFKHCNCSFLSNEIAHLSALNLIKLWTCLFKYWIQKSFSSWSSDNMLILKQGMNLLFFNLWIYPTHHCLISISINKGSILYLQIIHSCFQSIKLYIIFCGVKLSYRGI